MHRIFFSKPPIEDRDRDVVSGCLPLGEPIAFTFRLFGKSAEAIDDQCSMWYQDSMARTCTELMEWFKSDLGVFQFYSELVAHVYEDMAVIMFVPPEDTNLTESSYHIPSFVCSMVTQMLMRNMSDMANLFPGSTEPPKRFQMAAYFFTLDEYEPLQDMRDYLTYQLELHTVEEKGLRVIKLHLVQAKPISVRELVFSSGNDESTSEAEAESDTEVKAQFALVNDDVTTAQ
jgi:hypothetical protein